MREFELLDRIFAQNGSLPDHVLLPPGDDMALLSLGGCTQLLAAADSVIEGRHTPRGIDPAVIGRKAVLRNVSDVAAMANARPVATIATVVLPRDITQERAWRLYEGLRDAALAWSAPLVGGDIATTSSEDPCAPIIACVTILAVPLDPSRPVATRAAARDGDHVYVTGSIGGAWDPATGLGRHLDFTPRLAVAQALFRELGDRLGAMIDVSDGLGRDLGHIAAQSRVAIEIDLASVPVTPGCHVREALGHGEDYELAFTARGAVPTWIEGVPIVRIGRVRAGHAGVVALDGARHVDISSLGFEHDGGGSRSTMRLSGGAMGGGVST